MTVLYVVGSLLALLAVACWWEARSGKPAWNVHRGGSASTTRDASNAGKKGVLGAGLGSGTAIGMDGNGDG